MTDNIKDPSEVYLRKVITANLAWYSKTAFVSDAVVDSVVARIVSAINARYRLVERPESVDDSK